MCSSKDILPVLIHPVQKAIWCTQCFSHDCLFIHRLPPWVEGLLKIEFTIDRAALSGLGKFLDAALLIEQSFPPPRSAAVRPAGSASLSALSVSVQL